MWPCDGVSGRATVMRQCVGDSGRNLCGCVPMCKYMLWDAINVFRIDNAFLVYGNIYRYYWSRLLLLVTLLFGKQKQICFSPINQPHN